MLENNLRIAISCFLKIGKLYRCADDGGEQMIITVPADATVTTVTVDTPVTAAPLLNP